MTEQQGSRRRVEISSDGIVHKVKLDGVDLSDGCRDATLTFKPGWLPMLTIEPRIIQAGTYADPAHVCIPDATRELLIGLGWTPPTDSA